MHHRIRQMLMKEFLQMFRDVRMRMVVLGMPVVQLTILAFALTTDVKDIQTAMVDPDNTPESRELISAFSAGGYFDIIQVLRTDDDIRPLLDTGRVMAVLRIPDSFGADLRAGRSTKVQLLADGTMSNDTAIALNYAGQVMAGFNERLMRQRAGALGLAPVLLEVRPRAWYNPNLESKYYFVPGLITVMLLLIGMLLTSMAIVREKEIGTIEQIMVTPIRKTEFIIGKTLPFLITGYITMTMMFLIALVIFGIRIQGSLPLLYFSAGLYMIGNIGLALLVSVTSQTQQQALLTAFFILVPFTLLSGFIFPIRNMPESVQFMTLFNPMRWFLQIMHGIVIKGVGLRTLWGPILIQLGISAAFLTLAVAKFRKTLE